MSQEHLVNIPVADLRREPELPHLVNKKDYLQETQLLLGEKVIVHEIKDNWARVECPEQPVWRDGKWTGYPGWMRRDALVPKRQEPNATVQVPWATVCNQPLSLGSRLYAEPMDSGRYRIQLPDGRLGLLPQSVLTPPATPVATALTFIGAPYLWGGRSAYSPGQHTSVDCSGFINLVYRAHGKILPRNSHDQQKRCTPVSSPKPGDLVFLRSRKNPGIIDHVMLYIGNGRLLEATASNGNVREIDLATRLEDQNPIYGRP